MAKKIVYLSDLTCRDGSSLKLISNGPGSSCAFVHDRAEIEGVLDLEVLNANLAWVAPFEVEQQNCPTFYSALKHAASCVVQNADNMVTIRDADDDIVCYFML